MRHHFRIILVMIFILMTVTGCWNRRELNELGIVIGMGIDKVGKEYQVTVQVVNPGEVTQKGASGRSPVTTYQERGTSIMQTVRRMTTLIPRRSYFAHLRMLVIGEELAREGMAEVLDYLSRDHEFRTDFYIVVAKGMKANDILNILVPIEKIPMQNLFTKLEMSEKNWAEIGTKKLDELINDMVSKGRDPILTGIAGSALETGNSNKNVEMVDSPARLKYTGLAVLRDDKLVGWLNEIESKSYNYLQGKVKSTVVEVKCPKGGKIGIELIRTKQNTKAVMKNGRPIIQVEIKAEGNVGDVECGDLDLSKTKTIYDLEKRTEEIIEKGLITSVKKVQENYQSDIYGFGEVVHRQHPKVWKKLENDWNKEFAELTVDIKVDVKIRRVGTIGNSFLKDLKKEE